MSKARWSRGRLRLLQNRPRDALDDLLPCGARLKAAGCPNPGFAHWRSSAALAHLALGQQHEARELAAQELALARGFGAPRAISIALRTTARIEGGDTGIELLRDAIALTTGSPAKPEHAHALIDYGAALRRTGHRAAAQEPLRRGLDLATRCGAHPSAARATEELLAAGARPRRAALSGPTALTGCELRVAHTAADGHTNREIAQALFRDPPHRRDPPHQHLPQARHQLPPGATQGSDRLGVTGRLVTRSLAKSG
jgi:tetratricopeptide (TPR) repeat protein